MMLVSLSILDYEQDLVANSSDVSKSKSMPLILDLIQTGIISRIHIDVMKPPMIPHRTAFPIELIKSLYKSLSDKIPLAAHLMVDNPYLFIEGICSFVPREKRETFEIFIQRESFNSEAETVKALETLKKRNFSSGICLNLPTSTDLLTARIIESSDIILLMTVPMGAGGQEYSVKGSKRISLFSKMFPDKKIAVDGGINAETIVEAKKAGAKVAVVGSFITRSVNPVKAANDLKLKLKQF